MIHSASRYLILLLGLAALPLASCAMGGGPSGFTRERPGVFVSHALAEHLEPLSVEVRPATDFRPMSVVAAIGWTATDPKWIEYRIEFSPSSAAPAPWKPALLTAGVETPMADSAFDTSATDWRMEIRPRRE